tara:strand:+ start:535 stop:1104 length:570 start_codon:yes stop_codon:yes gene_type:complete
MKNEAKNFFNKSKILKFLLISPFLVSIPFINDSKVNAGLEFQWDQDSGYRRLKWLQKNNKRGFRNTIYFFLRPSDRKAGLLKISLKIPKTFKSNIKEEKVSLCQVKIGGFETRTKCIADIPADIELSEDKTSLDIFPYNPIPSNKNSYAIIVKVFNPRKTGLFQFHSYGEYIGNNAVSSYLGSSTLVID